MTALDIISAVEEHGGELVTGPLGKLTMRHAEKVPDSLKARVKAARDDVYQELILGFGKAGGPSGSAETTAAPTSAGPAEPTLRKGLRLGDDRVLRTEVARLQAGWEAMGMDAVKARVVAIKAVTGSDLLLFCDYQGCDGIVVVYDEFGAPFCRTHRAWAETPATSDPTPQCLEL